MNRKEKILRHINKNGCGVEIGPSHNPVAPKKEGYNVHIIDHMSREQLKIKYQEDTSLNLDNIEEVDFVWQGENYAELTGKSNYYDWIIASHVIEHAPDLIGFLQDCGTILKDEGVMSLVVPDKRYCFDHYRPVTGLAKIIDHHIQKNKQPSPGTVAEGYLNQISKAGSIAWDANSRGNNRLLFSVEDARHGMNAVMNDNAYVDVHTWCFVPHSFRLMIHDLFTLGLIPFQEMAFLPTNGCEFYMTLSRNGKGIDRSRLDMLDTIASEIKETESNPKNPETEQALVTSKQPETQRLKKSSLIQRLKNRFI